MQELLTEHYDITKFGTILEFNLNGIYHLIEFDNDHKIKKHNKWKIA